VSLESVLDYLERDGGFATSHYDDSYLDRRVTARMRRRDADTYAEYLDHLRDDDEEQTALLDALSINVTSFFRNPDVWGQVRELLRDLTDEQREVRVWSAPCADGREPYSIAMLALDDPGVDASRVSVTASDIDPEALREARRGVYESTRTTDIEEELSAIENYEEYVDLNDSRVEVREPVRELVSFDQHDLIRDEPRRAFDIVASRNFLIYIDGEYKRPIVETLVGSLRDGGYFVIGKTETIPRSYRDRFVPVDKRLRVYRYHQQD
jgi:chemotaxis protein methyltransferase CheR